MKLFLIDIPGWATHHVIVRAESVEQAMELARHQWDSTDDDRGATELNPNGPPGVLWAYVNSPDTGDVCRVCDEEP